MCTYADPEIGSVGLTEEAARLAGHTGLPLFESEHHFAAQSAMDTATELSGHLKTTAAYSEAEVTIIREEIKAVLGIG